MVKEQFFRFEMDFVLDLKIQKKIHLQSGYIFQFSKTERLIYNFLKIPAWNWSGSYLFFYGAWAQKESAKFQNMRACTDKTGLSSIKLVWLIQKAGWSADQRNLKMSAESLPLSRLI